MKSLSGALCFTTCFVAGVLGQSRTATPSKSRTATASGKAAQTHVVTVGKTAHQFEPDSLQANVGDVVTFQFFPPNHSVVRAEFHHPCIPYEYTGESKVGFNSDFFPINKILPNPPTWNLTINDTEPIFYYCGAPGSCIDWQMIGVINPNSSVVLDTQQQEAAQSLFMLLPGEPFPSEDQIPKGGGVPASSSSPPNTSPPSSVSPTPAPDSSGSNKLSGGAIAGIVVAAVFVVCLLGALFFLLGRHRTMLQFMRGSDKNNIAYSPGPQHNPRPEMRAGAGSNMPSYLSATPSSAMYSNPEMQSYQDGHFGPTPPYAARSVSPAPASPAMAELPGPAEKKGEGPIVTETAPNFQDNDGNGGGHRDRYTDAPGQESAFAGLGTGRVASQSPSPAPSAPSPTSSPRPMSWWGRSRSHRTASELSADASTGWKGGGWHSVREKDGGSEP